MNPVAVARQAMATRFEIVLHGDNPVALRAAGEEALDEIERWDARLSLYRPTSLAAHVNARAAVEPVRVDALFFRLLQDIQKLSRETEGAFDITIAPLMRCWGFTKGEGRVPERKALAEARTKVGMHLVELDPADFTVRFLREGVMLDFGAIGKGYALERAAGLLREAGIASAILHGGTSTVCAIGRPPDADSWKVGIEYPPESSTVPPPLLATVPLRDTALSVSAVWGRSFQKGQTTYGHVIDPRTGKPQRRTLMTAVVLPSATEADALSTALLVAGIKGRAGIEALHSEVRSLVVERARSSPYRIEAHGIELLRSGSLPPK